MTKGKVRWFNKEKGYGFIIPDDGSKDVFVHARELNRANIVPSSVMPDMLVSFTPNVGEKGVFATDVKLG